MSEKHRSHHEHRGEHTKAHESHESREHHARLEKQHEQAKEARNEHAEHLTELRREAHEEARSATERQEIGKGETAEDVSTMQINRSVKDASRRRVLKRIQRHLRPDEKLLSKITHQPAIDAVSRAAEKTVARPSGLFGGGLAALIGSSSYLWIAKHYGYDYNYLLFLFLFLGGFVLGSVIELLLHIVRHKKQNRRSR